jgi:hypothetical protein
VHLRDADRRAERRGLREDRVPERRDPGRDPLGVLIPLRLADDLVRDDREAGRGEGHLLDRLVHPQRRAENPRTDVGHARHLQEPLDRAVLAVRPVQSREDDVHGLARAVGPDELSAPRLAGERHRHAQLLAHLRHPAGLRGQRGRTVHHVPAAVPRDPDRHDLVALGVERVDHRPR